MKLSVRSLACPRSVLQRYHSEKHISEFYPYRSFTHKMAAKASWHRNYVTVTLCVTRLVNGSTFSGQFSSVPFICCERALSLAADSTRLNWTALWRRVRRRVFGITNMFIIQGEVTSQNLWSRYDRYFVGITWHDVWS